MEVKQTMSLFRRSLINDNIAQTVAFDPKRFVGLATLPLQDPQLAAEELKRCKVDLNLHGVEIGTHVGDRNIGDSFFDPVFKVASDLNMPLFVHPWGMPNDGRHSKYWLPWLVGMPAETTQAALSLMFSGTFEKFPNLKVMMIIAVNLSLTQRLYNADMPCARWRQLAVHLRPSTPLVSSVSERHASRLQSRSDQVLSVGQLVGRHVAAQSKVARLGARRDGRGDYASEVIPRFIDFVTGLHDAGYGLPVLVG